MLWLISQLLVIGNLKGWLGPAPCTPMQWTFMAVSGHPSWNIKFMPFDWVASGEVSPLRLVRARRRFSRPDIMRVPGRFLEHQVNHSVFLIASRSDPRQSSRPVRPGIAQSHSRCWAAPGTSNPGPWFLTSASRLLDDWLVPRTLVAQDMAQGRL